jgi:tRNA (cmo5U34)-methyltransferase
VTDTHDWLSPGYVDRWVHDWTALPERAEQLRRVAAAIPMGRQEPIRVLDVGGGWGPLAQEVLELRPAAQVSLIDFSPRMLEHARANLAPYGGRVSIASRDLTERSWPRGLVGPFDAVVSSLAIHNLVEPQVITDVYQDIRAMLRPGGCFLNLEIVRPASPPLAYVAQRWAAQGAGVDADRVPTPDPDQPPDKEGGPGRSGSVTHQLGWLAAAGFDQTDCLWLQAPLALLAGIA